MHSILTKSPSFEQRVLVVAAVAALMLLAWTWREVLLLAFAASLIAVGLHSIADPVARRTPLSKGAALLLAGALVFAIVVGIGWLFGSQIARQFDSMFGELPQAWRRLRENLQGHAVGQALIAEIDRWMTNGGGASLGAAFARAGNYTMSLVGGFTTGLLVIFAAAFLAASPQTYLKSGLMLFPKRCRPDLSNSLEASARALRKWLLGTLVSMTAISIMVGVVLWLLSVPAFLALALVAGLAQFVPVVGPMLAAVPGVLLALTVSPETAGWAALTYFVASQLEANFLSPVIQQRAVSLPPALTLFAILAMGVLFGPLGIMLAAPLTVVLSVLVVTLYVNGALKENEPVPGS